MSDAEITIDELRARVRAFVRERDWEQFHTPKELAAAIAIEAGELMEPFLWLVPGEAEELLTGAEARTQVEEELSDVVILCLCMANALAIDLSTAVTAKLALNAVK